MHRSSPSPARLSLLAERAAGMRSGPSWPERVLWSALRARQVEGVAFRRQVPLLGRFIADFLAPGARLIVEVDGPQHAQSRARDARRDRALERAGYRVLRLDAELVAKRLPEAVERVRARSANGPDAI